jgi:hypothetical protein
MTLYDLVALFAAFGAGIEAELSEGLVAILLFALALATIVLAKSER